MLRYLWIAMLAFVAGCVQIPPSPEELQAKKFDSVPGKAVIYIVRAYPDDFPGHGALTLDDSVTITMFAGNFYRWEVSPGPHRLAGLGPDMSRLTVNTEAGKVYFVQHIVMGSRRSTWSTGGILELRSERDGRTLVERARLLGHG